MAKFGSLSKEFPIVDIDKTIQVIVDGMTIDQLEQAARKYTNGAIPTILKKRFLLVRSDGKIIYDKFLSLVASEKIDSPRIRKIMYFLWAFRDLRLQRYICEVVADQNGKWQIDELTNKSNTSFFEEFFKPRTAKKVRSNIEYFLVESGILNDKDNTINLDLEDGWFEESVYIAAQYEPDESKRQAMLCSPVEYIIKNGLNKMANATAVELRSLKPLASAKPDTFEDKQIGININTQKETVGQVWNRPKPAPPKQNQAKPDFDPVVIERANGAHWLLEKVMNDAARDRGIEPTYNKHIDLYFTNEDKTVIAEMKSCHRGNLHSQVRRGIAQLLEYRFLYKALLGENTALVLVIEIAPSKEQEWLLTYIESLGILLSWKDAHSNKLVSSLFIPSYLEGIIFPKG